jgi:glycosyltransferase involved in cell wall biosynthesis
MKILQIHKNDHPTSGAAIMMLRLHQNLRRAGFDSRILSANKQRETDDSVAIPRSPRLESQLRKVTSRLGLNDIHCISSFKIKKSKAYLDADILHFHSMHGGFFSYFALPALTENKPAVFTLHDMWAFTGHCAISYDCERWKIGCGKCPYPDSSPAIQRNNTRLEWKLKNWVYRHSNLVIVTPSSRMTEQVKQSMLNRFPIYQIPHGIDCETYQPLNSEQCRSLLGVPPGKKVLMFAAMGLHYFSKGGDLLLKVLQNLPESLKAETVLLLLGDRGEALAQAAGLQTHCLGYIGNDRLKAIAYSAADLFVSPSRAESFGLTLLESMACGTPVVAFGVGGVLDLVRPDVTGYLAEPENVADLCAGIVQLLEDETLRNCMGQQCRALALKEYTIESQVQRYIELYRQVLQNDVCRARDDSAP